MPNFNQSNVDRLCLVGTHEAWAVACQLEPIKGSLSTSATDTKGFVVYRGRVMASAGDAKGYLECPAQRTCAKTSICYKLGWERINLGWKNVGCGFTTTSCNMLLHSMGGYVRSHQSGELQQDLLKHKVDEEWSWKPCYLISYYDCLQKKKRKIIITYRIK